MPVLHPRAAPALAALGLAVAAVPAFAADSAPLPSIEVIGRTPLPGLGVPRDLVPAPVQAAGAAEIDASHAQYVGGFLARFFGGVVVNDIAGNPLQADLQYRGYTASPLLGTPQGLSVYLDGVRLNQPFGDTVSLWIVPRTALRSVVLAPGSNPLYGLNTLGGAVVLETKDGARDPGGHFEATFGSHARRGAEFEWGGRVAGAPLDAYVAGNVVDDHGWRDDSPSRLGQLFGKLGWRGDGGSSFVTSVAYADAKLAGLGLQEQRFLARDYPSVYTRPDRTQDRALLVDLVGRRPLGGDLEVTGVLYYRNIRTSTFNGDLNEESLDQALYQPSAAERAALAAAGYTGVPASGENASNTPFPSWRCIANVLLNDEPNEKCSGLANRTRTTQTQWGGALDLAFGGAGRGWRHDGVVGVAFDASRAHFTQSAQFGYLDPSRAVIAVDGPGAFADGTQNSENAFDARVDLSGRTRTTSVYATDTLKAGAFAVTVSGRWNRSTVTNRDALSPGGGAGSLDGDATYARFNPAVGVTWSPSPALTAYAGWNEGARAPSSIELGCADPAQPCKLPNAMAGDPPLRQVVARTFELGLRGRVGADLQWRAGLFRAENRDDILFVASDQTGFGYFRNFGRTRRQGAELGVAGRAGPWRYGANYALVDATYQSAEALNGSSNSSNDAPAPGLDGNIEIRPGDRLPLVPRQVLKAWADVDVGAGVTLSVDVQASSGAYARGNENNRHAPDGVYYLGPGRSAGYAVLNLGADWRPAPAWRLFAQVDNVLDTRYATAAELRPTGFTSTGAFIARPFATPVVDGERPVVHATFYAPGAPRTFWLGVRYAFDAAR